MSGLILKDILTLRQQGKVYLFMLLFFGVFSVINKDPSFVSGMLCIFAAMLPVTAMSYDERSGWDKVGMSMPVTRKEMVLSKYALGFLASLVGILLSWLFILPSMISGALATKEAISMMPVFWSISIFLLALLLPLFYRFGVEKGRMLMMVAFFLPVAALLLINKVGVSLPSQDALSRFLVLAPLGAFLLFLFSYRISISIFRKKDL